MILVSSDLVKVAREACKLAGLREDVIWVLPGVDGKVKVERGMKSYERLRGKDGFEPVKFSKEELNTSLACECSVPSLPDSRHGRLADRQLSGAADLPFSSGTTGRAKGVSITQLNMLGSVAQMTGTGMIDASTSRVVMGCLPLYHIYGLVVLLHQTVRLGGTVVLMPRYDPLVWLRSVQEHRATLALIVPPIALSLVKHPDIDQYDLTSLRYFICGAAPLSHGLQTALQDRVNAKRGKGAKEGERTVVVQGWGMTETTSVGLLPDVRDGAIKPGSVGKLLPGLEARLVDEEDRDVKEGEAGELVLSGPNIMPGYYGNEKATRETFIEGRWMKTGDVCVRNEQGEFTIVDRRKELIKYKGQPTSP